MIFWKQLFLAVTLFLLFTLPVSGEDYTIVTPYGGVEENTFIDEKYGLKLRDSQQIQGLFVQSIDPEKHQWNIFLYKTELTFLIFFRSKQGIQ